MVGYYTAHPVQGKYSLPELSHLLSTIAIAEVSDYLNSLVAGRQLTKPVVSPVNPAANFHLLTNERFVDLSTIVTTHRKFREIPLKKEAEWYGLGGKQAICRKPLLLLGQIER